MEKHVNEPVLLVANLKWLFAEWPLASRFGAAAACGFRAVELSLPYALPVQQLRELLDEHGLRFSYLVAATGDWDAGDRGIACIPGREAEFRDGVAQAIHYALALGRPCIHAAAGILPEGVDALECEQVLRANYRWACTEAKRAGLRLVVEPVCRRDYPRYSVHRVAKALQLIEDVGADNLGIVLDFHHVQWEEGHERQHVAAALQAAMPHLWHVQLAFAPDRGGPQDTPLDVHALLAESRRLGYRGAFSCEYRAGPDTLASLAWARPYGIRVPHGTPRSNEA